MSRPGKRTWTCKTCGKSADGIDGLPLKWSSLMRISPDQISKIQLGAYCSPNCLYEDLRTRIVEIEESIDESGEPRPVGAGDKLWECNSCFTKEFGAQDFWLPHGWYGVYVQRPPNRTVPSGLTCSAECMMERVEPNLWDSPPSGVPTTTD